MPPVRRTSLHEIAFQVDDVAGPQALQQSFDMTVSGDHVHVCSMGFHYLPRNRKGLCAPEIEALALTEAEMFEIVLI